ncbi:MAG: hypothetical protein ACU84H_16920 [Gammaproteobacteria bacterium]
MKILVISVIVGIILLYFLNIALLKTHLFDLYWIMHAGLRFLLGFFILGISFFYAKALTFKKAMYITICIATADYIYDYYMEAYRFRFEIILHGLYMLLWGAILGYLTARYIKNKISNT